MTRPKHMQEPLPERVGEAMTNKGTTLLELTRGDGALVVFLRHAGCPFCREAASDLKKQRGKIEETGVTIVLVHQGSEVMASSFFSTFDLGDLHRIADPERKLYQAMELKRGNLWQIGGPKVWVRLLLAALRGHVPGKAQGDAFQMPGTFFVKDGVILTAYRHASQSDRPEYAGIACSV